eukprot:3480599-Rhodomonas_salina.1
MACLHQSSISSVMSAVGVDCPVMAVITKARDWAVSFQMLGGLGLRRMIHMHWRLVDVHRSIHTLIKRIVARGGEPNVVSVPITRSQ